MPDIGRDSRPAPLLPIRLSGAEWLKGSCRVCSAARCPESLPQGAKVAGCGTTRRHGQRAGSPLVMCIMPPRMFKIRWSVDSFWML